MPDNEKKESVQTPQPSEVIPAVAGGISAVGSASAPFVFFDEVGGFGRYNGIAHMTLEAMRFLAVNGQLRSDRVVVAHLRMNLVALRALKNTIQKIELLAEPVSEGAKN